MARDELGTQIIPSWLYVDYLGNFTALTRLTALGLQWKQGAVILVTRISPFPPVGECDVTELKAGGCLLRLPAFELTVVTTYFSRQPRCKDQ